MVNSVLMKSVKRDYPDTVSLFSITKEKRTNKHGNMVVLFRVEWNGDNSDSHPYFMFDSFSSAVDFVRSNFQV